MMSRPTSQLRPLSDNLRVKLRGKRVTWQCPLSEALQGAGSKLSGNTDPLRLVPTLFRPHNLPQRLHAGARSWSPLDAPAIHNTADGVFQSTNEEGGAATPADVPCHPIRIRSTRRSQSREHARMQARTTAISLNLTFHVAVLTTALGT